MIAPGRPRPTRVYSLDPAAFSSFRTRFLKQRAILLFAVVMLGVLVFAVTAEGLRNNFPWFLLGLMTITLALATGIVSGLVKGLRREKEAWSSFSLTVGEDFIARRITGYPELELSANQISAINESPEGITIVGPTRDHSIFINRALEDFEEVRSHLAAWTPVAPVPLSRLRVGKAMMLSIPLAFVFGFAIFIISDNPTVQVATGVPLLVALSACAFIAIRSKQLPDKTRRSMILIVFPLIGIIGRLVSAFERLR